jgi:Spy/CpxP family protein refolding chaperone
MKLSTSILAALLLSLGAAWSQQPEICPMHGQHTEQMSSPQAGAPEGHQHAGMGDAVQHSPVKTVTAEQAQALLNGEGMGMAKAAELNHYPGPRHVLQLASDLHLTPEQTAATQKLFDSMHENAVDLGEEILAREKDLDALFANERPSPAEVSALVSQIAVLEGRLRATHLLAHLKEREQLRPEQVAAYDQLRRGADGSGEHARQH